MSPGFLSSVLSGDKTLSPAKAASVAQRLGYSEQQSNEWVSLIRLHTAFKGAQAQGVPLRIGQVPQVSALTLDAFEAISDWHHYAIRELTRVKGFKADPSWIAARLGISPESAESSLERLLRLGLLKKDERGRVTKAETLITTPSDQPSRALRNFHSQMIAKALEALNAQPVDERDITAITMPVNRAKLDLMKKELRDFRHRMAKLFGTPEASDVYQLNIQLFNLTSWGQSPRKSESK